MTAVQERPSAPTAVGRPGPVPRRVRSPRWLDLRVVLGLLLVLGSVLLGARVVTAADATVPVWSVAGDLAAGTVLTADDLVPVRVRLDDAAPAYLSTSTRPVGRTLAARVHRGELLPRSALERPSSLVQIALPVQAGYVPPSLGRGQLVDVYAVGSASSAASAEAADVTPVVAGATVQDVSGRSQGVLSAPTTAVQVVISVTADRAPGILAAIRGRPLAVVVHAAGTPSGTAGSGPTG